MRSDVLKLITDYKFNTTDSPDAKLIIGFMYAFRSDIHARCNCLSDRNVIKKLFKKRATITSALN